MKHVAHSAGLSLTGHKRADNQDRWPAQPHEGMFLVADGMGAHRAGGFAARLVVETLPTLLSQTLTELPNYDALILIDGLN